MKFEEIGILLNCHTFEDFPVFHKGEDADSLLAGWTSLWHPSLVADCQKMPTWHRLDDPPAHDRARLLILPRPHFGNAPSDLGSNVAAAGGQLILADSSREVILERALEGLPRPEGLDDELVAEFLALGYAYLQVELLTRQMRYSTHVKETSFADNLVAAATAAVAGHREQAHTLVQSCFDFLSQERDHYYAVDVYLMDLALVVEPLLGEPLQAQLSGPTKTNLLMPAHCLAPLRQLPDSWRAVETALAEQRVGLIGGEIRELPTVLLAGETVRAQLELGLAAFEAAWSTRPKVYGRRAFGLASALPQILLRLGYQGALHATFDGGRFPEATQAKSRWEGDGQNSIDAICRAPLDATASETFLNLATSLGESMDMDHIATRCFVHLAGQASPWLKELQRVSRFTHALGRFVTAEEYFRDTYDPGMHDKFDANQYRSPALQQSVAAEATDPLSRWPRYWRNQLWLDAWRTCAAIRSLLDPQPAVREADDQVRRLMDEFQSNPLDAAWDARFAECADQPLECVRSLIGKLTGQTLAEPTAEHSAPAGYALVNPLSFARRVSLDESSVVPEVQPPIYAVDSTGQQSRVVVDVPGLGMASVLPSPARPRGVRVPPPLAEETLLRNEFLEAVVDPETGGLRVLRSYGSRSNRLSQQLACRLPGAAGSPGRPAEPEYSRMVADSCRLLRADSALGSVESRGRLVDGEGSTLAEFSQVFRVRRGSRVVELEIQLEPRMEFTTSPWESYLACRFAWANEAAELTRSLHEVRQPATAKRLEAPQFLEIDDGVERTAILTGGLPYHTRVARRILDSLLLVRGETQRHFRIGLAVDPKQPMREALTLISPSWIVPLSSPTSLPSAWMFHLDARHVIASGWQAIWQDDSIAGMRVRVTEVEGRAGQLNLRSFRPFASARKIDGLGQTVEVCEVAEDRLTARVAPQERMEIEALFADSAPRPGLS